MGLNQYVLGIDPGQRTGLALVEDGPKGLRLHVTAESALDLMRERIVRLLNGLVPEIAAVEDWEYQGPKRARGVAHQAYATGVAVGVLDGMGVRVVTVTRTQTLAALGMRRGRGGRFAKASKAAVAAWVRKLVPAISPEVGAIERSEHEWDAVAVAVAGLGVSVARTEAS